MKPTASPAAASAAPQGSGSSASAEAEVWPPPSLGARFNLDAVKTVSSAGSDEDDVASDEDLAHEDDDSASEEAEDSSDPSDPSDPSQEEEDAEDAEDAEEDEEDEEDAEEEPAPKGTAAMLKRIGKLTARAKGAEEERDALQARLDSLAGASAPRLELPVLNGRQDLAGKLPTETDLAGVERAARDFIAWAKAHRREGGNYHGHDYEPEDVADLIEAAQDDLREHIPFYRDFLAKRSQDGTRAAKLFPGMFGDAKRAAEVRQTVFSRLPFLAQEPDQDTLAAAFIIGSRVVAGQARLVPVEAPKKEAKPGAKNAAPAKGLAKKPGSPLEGSTPPPGKGGSKELAAFDAQIKSGKRLTPDEFARYETLMAQKKAAA